MRLARQLGYRPPSQNVHHRVLLAYAGVGLRPIRADYASDFHPRPTIQVKVRTEARKALAPGRPDLLHGGDFVCAQATPIVDLAPLLGRIPAPGGRFAVLGNHNVPARITDG